MIPGFHNIVEGHGIGIMATGMLIVFFGLLLLSFFIVALANLGIRKKPAKPVAVAIAESTPKVTEAELVVVTALVIYMESERSLGEWTQTVIPRQSRRGSISGFGREDAFII